MKNDEIWSITLLDGEVINLFDRYSYRESFQDIELEIFSIELDYQNGMCKFLSRDKKQLMLIPIRRIEKIHTVQGLQRK